MPWQDPPNTWHSNNAVITAKLRHFDVITPKWRSFDVITTSLLRNVSAGDEACSIASVAMTWDNTNTHLRILPSVGKHFLVNLIKGSSTVARYRIQCFILFYVPPVFLHGSVAKANNSWISTLSRAISHGRLNISSIWNECLKHLIQTTKWLYLIRWTYFLVRMAELLMLSHTSDLFIRPYDIATITSS